jgi:hypothetical protein
LCHSINIFRWNRLLPRRFWRPALHRLWLNCRPTRNRVLGPGMRSCWLPWYVCFHLAKTSLCLYLQHETQAMHVRSIGLYSTSAC